MKENNQPLTNALDLLQSLIKVPSFSKEETGTAEIIAGQLEKMAVEVKRSGNNIWCLNQHYDPGKATILLNSHHDTVRPNQDYARDPFAPVVEDGKIFGLGSNDAGGALVSLIETFWHFNGQTNLAYNLALACTAEEEISGVNGIASVIDSIPGVAMAIIGEPTSLHMAIAEKGLMVLDCTVTGSSGHAARNEGENAIYKAMHDIEWLQNYRFECESKRLGPVKMTVTMIEAGTQHNVVPDSCRFVVDVRTTDAYTNLATLEIIRKHLHANVVPRSTRLNSSAIATDHILVKAGLDLGLTIYGSPTLSDQALLSVASIKLGPGASARSHRANEFIYIDEIDQGIKTYIKLLTQILTK